MRTSLLPGVLVAASLLTASSACAEPVRQENVRFDSRGASLAGTIYLPPGPGPHPAIVSAHGSGQVHRGGTYQQEIARHYPSRGVAVFLFDKRGVRESGGRFPGGNSGSLMSNAADLLNAVAYVRSRPDIDTAQVGLWGVSQAGWVIPMAASAASSQGTVAFTIIVSGPTVSIAEEIAYSDLTGQTANRPSGLSREEIRRRLAKVEPEGARAYPYIEAMTMPGLWLYGDLDTSIPWQQGVEDLKAIKKQWKRDLSWHVFENANHGLRQAKTGGPWERPVPRKVVDGYFDVMDRWLFEHVKLKPAPKPKSD